MNFDKNPIRKITVDLTEARVDREYKVKANHLRVVDLNPFAEVYIRLNEVGNELVRLRPGMRLKNFEMQRLYISNDQHASCAFEIEYWSSRVLDGVAEIIQENYVDQVQGSLNHYNQYNNTDLQTVVTPSGNLKGIAVYSAFMYSTGNIHRMMHKVSAPTGYDDTDAGTVLYFQTRDVPFPVKTPIRIPAGHGLYYQKSGISNTSYVGINYEVI